MGCSGSKGIDTSTESDVFINAMKQEQKKEYKSFNWDYVFTKLNTEKTKEAQEKRIKLWKTEMELGNSLKASIEEIQEGMQKVLHLPTLAAQRNPSFLAFRATKKKYEKIQKDIPEEDFLSWTQFRLFLVYLNQYFQYWIKFDTIDTSGDHKIQYDEFIAAIDLMKKWGVKIENPQEDFKKLDINKGGTISFAEFCRFAIGDALDLENDTGYDDDVVDIIAKD